MNKSITGLKLSIIILTCLLVGCILTGLSAILPRLPYSITSQEELSDITFGFPIKFVTQSPNEEAITSLIEKGYNTSFILPRYDKYQTSISIFKMLLNVFILTILTALILAFCTILPRLTKKISLFLAIGLFICILSAIFPAPPGTFQTLDDIQPMRFGFPIKFIEQTPPIGTLSTIDEIEKRLSSEYWAPKIFYGEIKSYTTHIRGWLLILSILLNALIAAVIYNLFIFLKAAKNRNIALKYAECINRLLIKPLPTYIKVPEPIKNKMRQLQQKNTKKLPDKRKK